MRFCFDDYQLEFRAQLRAYLEEHCTAREVRAAWTSEHGWSAERWQALARMGVVGVTVPEEYGGLGLGPVDLVGLLEEAGRAALPEPLLETTGLAAPLLVDAASGDLPAGRGAICGEWLARIAGGDAVVTVALASAPAVPAAAGAHLVLLERDGEVRMVDPTAPGVVLTPRRALDGTRRLAVVDADRASSTVLATGEEARRLLSATTERAALCSAAVLVGLADRLVTMAADYARVRHQFGRAIGSFQAIKHQLADAWVRVEFARPVVYRAAWSLDEDEPSASRDASMAKAYASEAAIGAARTALQVHGAIGYTWEADLHLWAKRAWALAASWGDAASHRARVLSAVVAARAGAGRPTGAPPRGA